MSKTQLNISLIIPNYNYGAFLAESIESVLAQTRMPNEIVIIDDASSDNSNDVLNKYESDSRITKIIRNENNLGIVENFRKAAQHTTGDWIVYVGSDNRVMPDFLEKYESTLIDNPDTAIAYCDIILFGPLSNELAQKVDAKHLNDDRYLWEFPDANAETISQVETKNFMHGTSIFSRSWYDKVGGYKESNDPEDFNLFKSIVLAGGIPIHCPHATLEYRQHSELQANTLLTLKRELEWYKAYYEDAVKKRDLLQSEYDRLREIEDRLTKQNIEFKNRVKTLESRDLLGKINRILKRQK